MKEKFTKGEWKIVNNCVGVVDKSNTQSYGMVNTICFLDEYDFRDEWEANAHLIASAPEMYEMLKFLMDNDSINDFTLDIQVARLLAKARGESNE